MGLKTYVQWSQSRSFDFFDLLSSLSRILGIVSQVNYAAGSAYQDALAPRRCVRGLPGGSLDLGAVTAVVKGVRYVTETEGITDRIRTTSESLMMVESVVHQTLQAAIDHPIDHPQILLRLNTGPGPQLNKQGKSQLSRDARFLPRKYRDQIQAESHNNNKNVNSGVEDHNNLAAQLTEANTVETAIKPGPQRPDRQIDSYIYASHQRGQLDPPVDEMRYASTRLSRSSCSICCSMLQTELKTSNSQYHTKRVIEVRR